MLRNNQEVVTRVLTILGKVSTDSIHDVNLRMIKSGMAWHYSYFNSEKEYADAEKEARIKKTGLWIDANPINPYEFRRSKQNK